MKTNNIHEIIPDFLYLTKCREMLIFVKPLHEAGDDGNAIVLEQENGPAKYLEVIRTISLLKIVKIIKIALQKKNKSHRNESFRTLKCAGYDA